jgi:hypothetical protein
LSKEKKMKCCPEFVTQDLLIIAAQQQINKITPRLGSGTRNRFFILVRRSKLLNANSEEIIYRDWKDIFPHSYYSQMASLDEPCRMFYVPRTKANVKLSRHKDC